MTHLLKIPTVIGASSLGILEGTIEKTGLPYFPSFVPGLSLCCSVKVILASHGISPDTGTFYDRSVNLIYSSYSKWFQESLADAIQKLVDKELVNPPNIWVGLYLSLCFPFSPCLSVSLSFCLFGSLPLWFSLSLSLFLCLHVSLYLCLTVCYLQEIVSNMLLLLTNSDPLLDFPRPSLFKIIDIGGIGVKEPKKLAQVLIQLL